MGSHLQGTRWHCWEETHLWDPKESLLVKRETFYLCCGEEIHKRDIVFSCTMASNFHRSESQNCFTQLGLISGPSYPSTSKCHISSSIQGTAIPCRTRMLSRPLCVTGEEGALRGSSKLQSETIISCNRTQSNFMATILSRKTIILLPYN